MEENGEVAHFPQVFLENLATGNAAIHFWYIPVLAFLFLMTPLPRWLMKKHFGFIVALAALPLVVSRSTFPDFLEPQSFVYFLGAYGLGMLLGNKLDEATIFARKYKTSLVIIAILTSACVYLLFISEYQISACFSGVQTLIYLQKVLIFLWLLQWFESFKDNIPGALHTLGNHAFGIYFLHLFFMGIVISQVRDIASNQRVPLIIFALGALSLGVAVLGSMLVGWVL